ncbi:hypothetical protein K469DRAFT_77621 [Zopfia rhizophila CBS 207.26]|uniref:Uncharacterized protein n=1 Tax=Zopfia rhizophila CBS 207.26 TaxID=1314779 RepID=A0A6A6D7Y7_9PEZI|nr:hypothetical protein K469DRAFT_77621 [Zopfia rhizophila CBS 207.26]
MTSARAPMPAWAASCSDYDLTSTIIAGEEWAEPLFLLSPQSAILISSGLKNEVTLPNNDYLKTTLATRIYARVDTSQAGHPIYFCVSAIRTTCSFTAVAPPQPTGPATRAGIVSWYSEITFPQAWSDMKDYVIPCKEFAIPNTNVRGDHRCFRASTTVELHPERMSDVCITRWTLNFNGIRTCWSEKHLNENLWIQWRQRCSEENLE